MKFVVFFVNTVWIQMANFGLRDKENQEKHFLNCLRN